MNLRQIIQEKRPLIIAHRGASSIAPENTMEAYRLAVEEGADSIELDVQLSADGVPVVFHDEHLGRTAEGQGPVYEKTVKDLQSLDAGSWFGKTFAHCRIPTLEEVLAWSKGRIPLHIEVKNLPHRYPGIEEKILALLYTYNMVEEVEIISFDHPLARRMKALCPQIMVGTCYVGNPINHTILAQQVGAQCLDPQWSAVNPQMVAEAHDSGLLVITWTVNDPDQAVALAEMGVDAITTDYPKPMIEALISANFNV